VLTYDAQVVGEWYNIVEEYTVRRLTRHRDVFAALGGLASALLDKYREDYGAQYCAGLWVNDILNGIVWQRIDSSTLERPEAAAGEGSAPSWSWLSVKGQVLSTRGRRDWPEEDAELISCGATTQDGDDQFGRLESGKLRLRARILKCPVTQNSGGEEAELAKLENIKQSLPVDIYRPGQTRDAEGGEDNGSKEKRNSDDTDEAEDGEEGDGDKNDEGGAQLVHCCGPWEIPPTFHTAPVGGRSDLVACLRVQSSGGVVQQETEGVNEQEQQRPFASVFFDDEQATNLSGVYCAYVGAINRRDIVKE
jgi:hypothetical protein